MRIKRKRLSGSAAKRLDRLASIGVELDRLEWTFGIPADALEAALDEFRRVEPVPIAEPDDAAETEAGLPPSPSPPLRRALEALGERATATVAGYALDGAPASVPDLIRAARRAGVPIAYPGVAPLSRAFATGPSVRHAA